ncbi:response regulator [Deinococcus petrolearius]|uniref:Response regulator n=1 Tax=Deinococcus petrolearius TaxID=1751295 RepID=A0ABW1DIY2_9DEIO
MPALRVLLVDDNPADLLLAREVFQDHPDVQLTTFQHGPEALDYLQHHGGRLPDVILLDISMPVMNGFELLEKIKRDNVLLHIPVVMLTTSAHPGDVKQAYTLHANSYLVKSESFPEFMAQVDSFVSYWQQNRLLHRALLAD